MWVGGWVCDIQLFYFIILLLFDYFCHHLHSICICLVLTTFFIFVVVLCCNFLGLAMALAKFYCQAMCNFFPRRKILKERKRKRKMLKSDFLYQSRHYPKRKMLKSDFLYQSRHYPKRKMLNINRKLFQCATISFSCARTAHRFTYETCQQKMLYM